MKRYIVRVTDTWEVSVEASSESAASRKALKMPNCGYTEGGDCDGAEVVGIEEDYE